MGRDAKGPFRLSDRHLRKILRRVDKQRVVGIAGNDVAGARPWPMVMQSLPYSDERFSCGLLTCEYRGWVETFGDEMPFFDPITSKTEYNMRYRITQAGRAVLDRTRTISNVALLVAIASLLASIGSVFIALKR
jgi:hypothetical protein